MFGLLRVRPCKLTAEQKYRHRLHYCGTCKTLSRLYGQSSRILLNHDAVFLGEILSALELQNIADWSRYIQSYNCTSIPRENELPLSLQFAATANILLTEFKVADHIQDSNQRRWKLLAGIFDRAFRQAVARLEDWAFPLPELRVLQNLQTEREKNIGTLAAEFSPEEALKYLAFPTAKATAMFFSHGAKLIGKENLQSPLYRLGYDFGRLIYLLDAYEDFERDAIKNEFNAFRIAFHWAEPKLSTAQRQQIRARLLALQENIVESISRLSLPPATSQQFIERIKINVAQKLSISLPVITHRHQPSTLKSRWLASIMKTKKLLDQDSENISSLNFLKTPFVFAFVALVIFLFPKQSVKSTRECFELSANLMFLSALPGAIIGIFLTALPPELSEGKKKGKASNSGCGSCGDGCCDGGCDCCCFACSDSGCDCCSGCCDGCDCNCCD